MELLESVLGYTFRDPSLLTQALTHSSLGYESQHSLPDNQRLEFLGDAVLQLLLSEMLFHRYKKADEGLLTKVRSQLVSSKALASVARHINLGTFLLMGRGEESHGGRDRESSLADALEAIAGAVFLDGGMDSARNLVSHLFAKMLDDLGATPSDKNPKGQLQELLQAINPTSPHYQVVSHSGPDHAKTFLCAVIWCGRELGRGTGRSKKEAEVEAARVALDSGTQDLKADYRATKISTFPCEKNGQNSPQVCE